MARYINDQNKVVLLHESGTYGSSFSSGNWPGFVQSNSLSEEENLIESRYLGAATRNWSLMDAGPRDYTGTLTINPQDARFLAWAIGSVVDTSGANSTHVATEVNNDVRQSAFTSGTLNPPISFTLEDSKTATGTGKNFIRTINGCVIDNVRLNWRQGEKVTTEVDYVAQTVSYASGTTTSVTQNANRPYLWSDVTVTLGGSVLQTNKEGTFEIAKNVQAPHYVNGSREIAVPFEQNRNYTLDLTLDADGEQNKALYDQFFKGGSSFNTTIDLNAAAGVTGSQRITIVLSGCRITSMDNPSEVEGNNEQTVVIRPQVASLTAYDRVVKYNPY